MCVRDREGEKKRWSVFERGRERELIIEYTALSVHVCTWWVHMARAVATEAGTASRTASLSLSPTMHT